MGITATIGEALTLADSIEGVAHVTAGSALSQTPRAVVARVLVPNGRKFRAVATAGDLLMTPDRTTEMARAVLARRPIETALAPGYRSSLRPLIYRDEVFGLLEVVAPRESLHEASFVLEWLGAHSAIAFHRVKHEDERRSMRLGDLATSLSLGMKIATSAHRGVQSVVETLTFELSLPAVALAVPPDGSACHLEASAGLDPATTADLASLIGSRDGATRDDAVVVAARQVRAALRVREVTTIDAGAFAFVIGGACEAFEEAGAVLAEILGSASPALPSDEGVWTAADADRLKLEQLTDREREVLGLLAAGMGTTAIARTLVISPKTVKTHVQNILRKLDAESRLEAAAIAVRCGIVPEPVA